MAENNSSAPLLPCPFCGASARGYEIEPHQHSAALLALVPNMPKEHHGSYAIEGDCQCGSGLIGNNQAEVTARWNARSPQAVAAQAAPAAEPLPLLVRDIARDLGITTLEACQALKGLGNFSVNSAVTADMASKLRECFPESAAAPAAVAVPDEREAYIDWLSGSHPRVFSKTDAEAYWRDKHVSALAWQARAALAATPALPATEDSSAGDLAEVKIADEMSREERMIVLQRDSDGTPIVWCDPEIADIVCALNSGGVKTVASCSGHGVKPGGIALADGRQLLLLESLEAFNSAMSAITQAEVQAEPVAWMRKTDITELTDSEPETNGWTPLYVAPQAQPADALDAKRWRAAAHDLSLKNLALVSVDDYGACEMLTGDEANEAIDAAMASAQEGGNAAKEV